MAKEKGFCHYHLEERKNGDIEVWYESCLTTYDEFGFVIPKDEVKFYKK